MTEEEKDEMWLVAVYHIGWQDIPHWVGENYSDGDYQGKFVGMRCKEAMDLVRFLEAQEYHAFMQQRSEIRRYR